MSARRRPGEGGVDSYSTGRGVRYRATWREPEDPEDLGSRRVQRTKGGFEDYKAAATFLRKKLTDVEEGRIVRAGAVTFGRFAAQWLAGFRGAATTSSQYRRYLRLYVDPHLGDLPLDQVRATTLAALYRRLERSGSAKGGPLSPSTVRKVHVLVNEILQTAVDDHRITTNPARHPRANPPSVSEVRGAHPETVTWSPSELTRFLSWTERQRDDPLRYLWTSAALTGLRRGELLGLTWGDVDLDARVLSVRRSRTVVRQKGEKTVEILSLPKSRHARAVDLGRLAVEALRAQRRETVRIDLSMAASARPVFSYPDGTRIPPDMASKRFGAAVRRYNAACAPDDRVPQIRLHDLRHTHATHLLQAGAQPKVVQERLGHSTISITMDLYSHVMPTVQREAVDRFEATLTAAAQPPAPDADAL
jgi:integrase